MPEAAAAAEEMAGCEYIMSDLIGGNLLFVCLFKGTFSFENGVCALA